MRPLIGIPCHPAYRHGSQRPIYGNNRSYVHAIEDAGGVPVLIPLMHDLSALETLLSRLDGLLLPGGQDIQPRRYGEEPHPRLGDTDPALDEFELTLAHWALRAEKPILGICRGMQLLNVALGGTLYQDLESQYAGSLRHMNQDLPRSQVIHRVLVEPGTCLAAITGEREFWANSIHHQAVKEPGKGVRIAARAEDGVVEAIEVPTKRFVLALQCHPEEIYRQVPACARVFSAFVQACGLQEAAPQSQRAVPLPVGAA
uniref:Gamma-glutamyl-gamma-aminobutyrate hydrolase n=1 Tax=Thermogemmatispora argillosa TaxID=2045280 RepID=A0A455T3S9_9CHLR|nr:gamma-glutamyl-gamma-aminobutyrate hydrolase [Thermogemmatispora argillosa]